MEKELKTKLNEQINEKLKQITEEKINASNLDDLFKVVDIYKDLKEVENMNYGNYGNNYANSYGRPGFDSYGRRGYDMKYRGEEYLDRVNGEYGRYSDSMNRYGAGADSDKSFHYMMEALKDFIKVLHEEASTPQQKQMLQEAIQTSMMM